MTHGPLICTIGHSKTPIDEFVAILQANAIRHLLDVRTVPRSRHNPQFNSDSLRASLADAGIGYAHAAGLGGFGHARPASPNAGWRNVSFRGSADYMQPADFAADLASLVELARGDRVTLMCA